MHISSPIRLVQFTDTHLLGAKDAVLRGVQPFATLQAVRNHAARRFTAVDGVLLTGDLVNDDAAGYELIRETFSSSAVPVYCTTGNHDLPVEMRRTLAAAPFHLDDHVVLGDWLVVLLDTWLQNNAGGQLGQAQLQRLEALLQAHPQHHTLICLHHHPITMSSHWLDQVGLFDAAAFNDCVARHSQVRGVLWGHVHQALDQMIDGVRYMATPATCAQFLPQSYHFAIDSRPPGYRTLELGVDGTIATEVVWLE
jgi:Icc protein